MSYSKSYTCQRGWDDAFSPYDDWLKNKNESVSCPAIFRYNDHMTNMRLPINNSMATYFCPNTSVLLITVADTFFGYSASVSAKLIIDKNAKSVAIAELSAERYDRLYPEHATSGGIELYEEIVREHDGHFVDISLEQAVVRFFGYAYCTKLSLPAIHAIHAIPSVSEETAKIASTLPHWFDSDHSLATTFTKRDLSLATMQTVCLFPDVHACTLIQSYFRGWLIRRKYRFDPSTTLGKYLALRLFREMVST